MNPLCVIDKIKLEQVDNFMFICPKCRKTYNLYYEVMSYEETIESVYDESGNIELAGLEATGPLVEFLDDEQEFKFIPRKLDDEPEDDDDDDDEEAKQKRKIRIPKYMESGPGREVIDYKEETD